jgi:uncharacterized surface protein with fasciclin (FAS1) repeats
MDDSFDCHIPAIPYRTNLQPRTSANTMLKRTVLQLSAAAALLALGACASTPAPTTITDTVARTPQLSTLSRLLTQADLADALRGAGPFTLFAPSDEAFKAVPAATMTQLANDKAMLRAVLSYHVVPGKLQSADIKNGPVKTLQGANVQLSKSGTFVTVEDAVVQQADIQATNGVVHIIDRVLIPPKQ